MKPRYIPPKRPKQPSADDQALARVMGKVVAALRKRMKEAVQAEQHKVDLRNWQDGDFLGLAHDATAAYDQAMAMERARDELNDDIPDLFS